MKGLEQQPLAKQAVSTCFEQVFTGALTIPVQRALLWNHLWRRDGPATGNTYNTSPKSFTLEHKVTPAEAGQQFPYNTSPKGFTLELFAC